jgi:dihydrofolate reductase
MGELTFEISVSVDGFVAGPDADQENPLGIGGERLHDWVIKLQAWRETHHREGGEHDVSGDLLRRSIERVGAAIMGRKMFSGQEGPWGDEPFEGWWGDEPPFHYPVFVLTHHEREPLVKTGTTFTFVTDGIESALEQARAAAGDKNVAIAGGAEVAQQYLAAGHVDEMLLHVAPVLLGDGVRLFERLGDDLPQLEIAEVIPAPDVTHVRYRVVR